MQERPPEKPIFNFRILLLLQSIKSCLVIRESAFKGKKSRPSPWTKQVHCLPIVRTG